MSRQDSRESSQARENNEAKMKLDKERSKGQSYAPTQDMISAEDYESSSNPVSQDMIRSRKKAENFEQGLDRDQSLNVNDKTHITNRSVDKA